MKVAVIGCTHAGTFSAQEILTQHPDAQVTVYERNDNLSFLSCGIALWVGNNVSDPKKMFYSSPEALTKLGATMKMEHDVTDVDLDQKTVTATNLKTGETKTEAFDKIVITTGSKPVVPNLPGIHGDKVYQCKNWNDANRIKEASEKISSAVVIGAGYIGAEIAEQLSLINKEVTLIDGLDRVLANNFDQKVTDRIEDEYRNHGVKLALGEMVKSFNEENDQVTVETDKGSYTADIAVLAIGFLPRTDLFTDKLDMLPNGAIITNEYMETSKKDVFAAGDASSVFYNPTGKADYIPLATNAVRQGILVGNNIEKPTVKYLGTQATSAVELYGYALAASGLNAMGAKKRGVEIEEVSIEPDYRPDFMPTTTKVLCTLVWDPTNRQVLGGSFMAKHDISQAANVISLAIQSKMTIDDLAMVDFFFQPNFDQPINYIGAVASAACAKSSSK
ncbi:FAD-dependent oxidoreductase [Xylocopilactobacillus apicola]|uniref:Pyridine nucleotide-disulfide oxidoreductase n=1 Tax=Xylocopilactobacillus apicola TaxID=2932184 RepID=A0AAU9DKE2_9LACO|nr:FAD-dependent oxidoreductase [Xylocopilactobacillus apicola]BDR59011.1 pyridine nucleotide-disulfide oxidoreductase [Xylocopilactobacillus apicola]